MFDWDPRKARANEINHWVPFEEAATAFLDPDGLDGEDLEHSASERRRFAWLRAVWGEYWLSLIPKGDVTMKKSHGLSARGERTVKKGRPTRSKKIDFSDIPELSENQLSRMRRIGRPTLGDEPRRLIAIRLDAKVLEWLRKTAAEMRVPYQSLVNQILAKEMRKAS